MNRTRPLAAIFLAAAVALVLAGCRGGGTRPGEAPSGGNVLRYALPTVPTELDPALVQDGDTIDLLQQVFEGLVQWNEKSEVAPNLAERWEVSEDGRTYTFHLKKGVKFHNGREMTAKDVEYSLVRVLTPATKALVTATTYLLDIDGAPAMLAGTATTVPGIEVLDDHTVRITTDKRRPYFLGKLTYPTGYVVCREAIEASGAFTDKAMVGTGPFKLKEYQSGHKVILEANADYHGGRPILDGLERPILVDSTSRQTTYESGGTDLTDVDRAELSRVTADPVLSKELREFPRPAIWYLGLNQKAFPPFRDRRVRRAFAMAIDKQALVRLALRDRAQVAQGIVPPGVPGHQPDYHGIAFDPAAARALLASAGYPGGKGFPSLTITYRQGYKHIEDSVMAMRSDLQQNLGIEVRTQQMEWQVFLRERDKGTMPCFHLRWAADYLDPQDFLSVMLRTGATENGAYYSNAVFDRLCDAADVEGNPARRAALYRQAEDIAVQDAPWVCLYYQHDVELHKPYLKGLRHSAFGHLPHTKTTVAR